MDYQNIINSLLYRGYSIEITCDKSGYDAFFVHDSIKQSYVPLPQAHGNNLENLFDNIVKIFKVG
jgi:hypothetical protein